MSDERTPEQKAIDIDDAILYTIIDLLDIDRSLLESVPDSALRPILVSLKETLCNVIDDLN